jgi:hypothetical protein
MLKWSRPSVKRAEKRSFSRVCTNPVNVSTLAVRLRLGANISAELNMLTGIAAILTYPLDIEVVEMEEREEKERLEKEKREAEGAAEEE